MDKNPATYSIVLFTKQPKKDGSFPLKLRITYQRQQKYFGIGWSFTETSWNKIKGQTARGDYRDIKLKLLEIEKKAKQVIAFLNENEEEFSFTRFEEIFFNQNNDTDLIFEAFAAQITDLNAQGRISSAGGVASALKSFESFFNNRRIRFRDVTAGVLSKYEKWMVIEQQNSVSTVGIYLRSMRALFNRQIAKGLLEGDKYPFGKYKY